jgi:hypothetical protein
LFFATFSCSLSFFFFLVAFLTSFEELSSLFHEVPNPPPLPPISNPLKPTFPLGLVQEILPRTFMGLNGSEKVPTVLTSHFIEI